MLGHVKHQKEQKIINYYKTFPLLENLNSKIFIVLGIHAKEYEYTKSHRIFECGKKAEGIYFIVEGNVKVNQI